MSAPISLSNANAVELLEKKIAKLDEDRMRIRDFNKSCRAGTPDLDILTPALRRDYLSTVKSCPCFIGPHGEMPTYVASNLGGVISRERKRLAQARRMYPTPLPDTDESVIRASVH